MANTILHNESIPSQRKKIIVLGSGPNRIGQGIEFDYCCVHGLLAIKECGYEAIMVNCNPETVSTDFDMADKLYFEPVYWEHLWEIIELEQPYGIIVQLGGQTALKLSRRLHEKGIRIIGTSFDNMDIAEDRGRFSDRLKEMGIPYPNYGTAYNTEDAIEVAKEVGYPVLIRPSYVLGGQRMRIVLNDEELEKGVLSLIKHLPGNKILIDHFLDRCQEAEIDAIYDYAKAHGATGGKLLGAGGGGYFLFFVDPFERSNLKKALHDKGLKTQTITFDHEGLKAWSVRNPDKEPAE